ncbi:hypothetical protein Smp_076590 [Schistosoma mansoni]|nr:hypothetical protein Smp_076590 [Schistosoma mansoni]|eukprot:XP_018646627.1 hypothetical protein Smp_076590 [Schistosoma mansoni]
MGSLWVKNVFSVHLSEEELQSIPHLKIELLTHIALRTVQTSCFFGAIICAPVITLLSKPRTLRCLTRRSVKFATYGFLPGLTIAPILMYARMKDQPDEAFYDRCYRLRCNKNQLRVDRFSYIGLGCGGIAGFANAFGPMQTAVIGMMIGTVAAVCCNQIKSSTSTQK